MPEDRSLQETLDELRAELRELEDGRSGAGEELPEDARRALRQAVRQIERTLGEDVGASDAEPESLRERLGDALERFQGEHPRFAALVNRVIMTLDYLGI